MDSIPEQHDPLTSVPQEEVVGFTQLLNSQWIERLQQFDQLIVGFSGGLDSTVLLHCIASHAALNSRLLAVHINHGISPNALHWQRHCEDFCHDLNIPFITEEVEFNRSSNIEEEARVARFTVFSRLLNKERCLLLGQHLDDQAETVLLQLFRGAGIDGLVGIQEYSSFSSGIMARPFLTHARAQLHHYALTQKLECYI
jgi:tRNA(Ile)-lysidine synthase